MQLAGLSIINVLLACKCLTIGIGDDPEDIPIDVPELPPHLSEWSRRASKVDIEVLILLDLSNPRTS